MDSFVSGMTASTHPVQFAAMGIVLAIDLLGLVWINRIKQAQAANSSNNTNERPYYSWEARRNACWAYMGTTASIATALDVFYPISGGYMGAVKAYLFAFPLGLLDLYFSNVPIN